MKPTLFFPFIHSYGLMLAVGFYAAWWLAARRAKAQGEDPEMIGNLVLLAIVAGVAGARLLYFWQYDAGQPLWTLIEVWKGGLVFYGGLVTAAVAIGIYLRIKRANMWKIADIVAPSLAIGQAFGRLGCFLPGCCYGGLCTGHFPLGVRFPPILGAKGAVTGSAPFLDHVARRWITDAAGGSLPIHPTQVYAAIGLFAIGALVLVAEPHKRRHGQLLALVAILNALSRFGIELIRRDSAVVAVGLKGGQVGAIVVLAAGIGVLVWTHFLGRPAWASG